jgi:hypothetical protein
VVASPEEPTTRVERIASLRRFARDVAVNVVGNLIAVAVIYLSAVIGGAIPRNPYLVLSAGFVIFVGSGTLVLLLSYVLRGRWKMYALVSSVLLIGLGAMAVPFLPDTDVQGFERVGYFGMGVGGIVLGVMTLIDLRRRRIDQLSD